MNMQNMRRFVTIYVAINGFLIASGYGRNPAVMAVANVVAAVVLTARAVEDMRQDGAAKKKKDADTAE